MAGAGMCAPLEACARSKDCQAITQCIGTCRTYDCGPRARTRTPPASRRSFPSRHPSPLYPQGLSTLHAACGPERDTRPT
jgi:hypothetical protein